MLGTVAGTITNDTFMDDLGTSGADGTLFPGTILFLL